MSIEKVTQLPEDFQGINPHNLYLYAKAYLANLRAGTAHTKTRSDVKGGGKKPWRQKGTGRARVGSTRNPSRVHGGAAFGPKPRKYNLKVIIDGAQSFGAEYKGKAEVHHCDIYTTSFFPAKPLGCFGDGGAILTNNSEFAERMRMLRVHGQNKRYHHKYIGLGARMDTIQAAIVNVKLKYYKQDFEKRNKVAKKYNEMLRDFDIILPIIKSDRSIPWAQYSIRIKNRDEIQNKLKQFGIPTAVHYPMPLHLQECFSYLGYEKGDFPVAERVSREIMSLPMNPDLSDEEIEYVVNFIK